MQDVPGQVMEVVEHSLHYVTDIGLHYAYLDDRAPCSAIHFAGLRAVFPAHVGIV